LGAAADGGGFGEVEDAALTLEELCWAAFVPGHALVGADCDGHDDGGGGSDSGGGNDSG